MTPRFKKNSCAQRARRMVHGTTDLDSGVSAA